MKIPAPTRSVALCLFLWVMWTLTNRGWFYEIPVLRTWSGNPISEVMFFLLLFFASLALAVRNLCAWRHRERRAQVHVNLLCIFMAALIVFELPSRAATMFYFWHDEFEEIAHSRPWRWTEPHWKYGAVRSGFTNRSTTHFDYGLKVAGLVFNPNDRPQFDETQVLCRQHKKGGFVRRLEENWFLCDNLPPY